ncbi:MAG: hypothetical protein P0116_02770 [Candidatus Nitrosocosmicus sp.]|nr:hypothetical protein [Candidatus Nitrosocosmicus sp.]
MSTAVITLAALINSLTLLNKKMASIRVVISGAGSLAMVFLRF